MPPSVPGEHPFSIANVPFGVVVRNDDASKTPRCVTRYGDEVFELAEFDIQVPGFDSAVFKQPTLNAFAACPYAIRRDVRKRIQELLPSAERGISVDQVTMRLPVFVGDFTDFLSSEYHTLNAGRLMKAAGPPLPPAWAHMPIAYAGRASSVVVSDTPIRRPRGGLPGPSFGPTKSLDMEYEMGAVIGGKGNEFGDAGLDVNDYMENIFGLVILNDWSARDIQGFEMIPLGPFNGKNFGTTISPWVVTLDALEPFKTSLPARHKDPQPTWDIELKAELKLSGSSSAHTVTQSNLKHLAYSFGQMVAHHTTSGCNLRPGDILGSGTISGPTDDSLACLLEICERGTKPLEFEGEKRVWLEDGDEVLMTAVAKGPNGWVGFGNCNGKILPAHA